VLKKRGRSDCISFSILLGILLTCYYSLCTMYACMYAWRRMPAARDSRDWLPQSITRVCILMRARN